MEFLANLDFWFTVLRCTTPVLLATCADRQPLRPVKPGTGGNHDHFRALRRAGKRIYG